MSASLVPRAPWVILLAYRCKRDLPSCLRALARTEGGPPPLVVVDNGCPERSADGVESLYPGVQLVRTARNLGFAGGAMLGIRHALAAGAEDVLLLNPDAFPEPPWLVELLAAAERRPDAGILGSLILDEDGVGLDRHQQQLLDLEGIVPGEEPVEVVTAIGAALLLRGKMLREIGEFHPLYFLYGEETDLAVRARQRGFKVLLVPRSRVRHRGEGSQTTAGLRLKARWFRMRADGLLLLKRPHLGLRTGLIDLAARTLSRGWRDLIGGRILDAALRAASVPWLLSRLPAVRRSRRAEAAGAAHLGGMMAPPGDRRAAPRVAFVVAALNAEGRIHLAIESALGQTIPEVEVVVVDDGSSDGTAARAASFAERDPRVSVETQENRGPGAARNLGVCRCRAPYLCFLDDDDLVPSDKARTQADYLDRHPEVSVVYSRTRILEPGGKERECPATEDGGALAAEILAGGDRGFPCHAAVVRRCAFDAVGGFRERRPLVEDLDLWVRLAAAGHRFAFLPEPAALYRERPGSRSTRILEVTEGRLETLAWLHRNLPREPRDRRTRVRVKARYRCSTLAGSLAGNGRKVRARRFVLRSLRWARRAGEVAETLAGLVAPTRFSAPAAGDPGRAEP